MTDQIEDKELGEKGAISVSGQIAAQLYLISTSHLTLTTTFARNASNDLVLLPLIDWQLIGQKATDEADQETVLGAIVPFENMAFLIGDMCNEFARASTQLCALSNSSVAGENLDLVRVRDWLRRAAALAAEAADNFDELIDVDRQD